MDNSKVSNNMETDESSEINVTGDLEVIRLLERIEREAAMYVSSVTEASEGPQQQHGLSTSMFEDGLNNLDPGVQNEESSPMELDLNILDDPEVARLLAEIESDSSAPDKSGSVSDNYTDVFAWMDLPTTREHDLTRTERSEEEPLPSTSKLPSSEQPGTSSMIENRNMVQEGGAREAGFMINVKKVVERRTFRARETIYEIKLNEQKTGLWKDNLTLLGTAIESCLSKATSNLQSNDRIKVYINQKGLENPISHPLKPIGEVTVHNILGSIEKVLQSKTSLQFDESFELNIATVSLPKGGTGARQKNIENLKVNKKSLIQIQNKDRLCLARAVSVAMAYKLNDENKSRIACNRYKLQKDLAIDLCLKANITPSLEANLDDVLKIEQCLNIQIAVISSSHLNSLIYKGADKICKIYLFLDDNHFHAITNVKAFYCSKYYCEHCDVPYSRKQSHRCENICTSCYVTDCIQTQPTNCSDCNRTFRNKNCFNRHKEAQMDALNQTCKSLCQTFWKCPLCNNVLDVKNRTVEEHLCGEMFCRLCKKYYSNEQHICYIKPKLAPKPCHQYIFFDFECSQDTNEHIPNFLVAQKTCSSCIEKENFDDTCKQCGKREIVYQGLDTVKDFCQWLFSDQHKNFTVIAHNARGYDGVFLLRYLLENAIVPKVSFSGTKIMYLEVPQFNIRVIDSLNHIPMSLSKFPKSFGLTELRKGYFPHFFNTPENQNYVGPFPSARHYGYETMSVEGKETFLKWYSEQEGKTFNFRNEMFSYCKSDVDILRRSCLKFRKLILEVTTPPPSAVDEAEGWGVDPLQFVTIASLCFGIFRHLFLKPGEIARVPSHGINVRDQYSDVSIQWLLWIQENANQRGEKINIQHAINGREKRLGKYRFDGYDEENKTIYEYNSCYFHGCDTCYEDNCYNTKVGLSMKQLRDKTLVKKKLFESMGYTYITKWDHVFQKEIKNDPKLKAFIDSLDIQSRLNPSDAFFGGRTNAFRLYHEVKGDEKIHYLDFCSLYPSLNKYMPVPVKIPIVITENFEDISKYDGFAKAKVLPPKGLLHPVLPLKTDKLLFPLCRTCAIKQTPICNHNSDERCLIGTWVTPELKLAVKKGYKIIKLYEVHHFPEMRVYDGLDIKTGLFSEYINTFLTFKQQASGWPDWCKTDADKESYIRKYFEKEKIHLDRDAVCKNPGLRTISKALLTNFWGKWGQRNDLTKTEFMTSAREFFALLVDQEKEVHDFKIFSEDIAMVGYRHKGMAVETGVSSNVWVAAFTTAWGRLKLYELLDTLGDRVLYCDTDSVIFVSKPGDYEPPQGDYLGDLTNELETDEYIKIFVSGGAKNYGFISNKQRQVCKIRGFTLNATNALKLNFETVSAMVQYFVTRKCSCISGCETCKSLKTVSIVNERKISRDKYKFKIINKVESKDYRVCYTKRVVLPDFTTLPFGY